ncbi:MAG: glycosyl transferase family 36 [Melioribacteraceae bacterium]|nr:glycosyl transferase family 36 [Melioribacteraceae bacterium]
MKTFETKYGYFDNNGKEYVIKNQQTPKPWINVISNGNYGMVISQTGGGFSWKEHSEFNRITRWHQDLIKDDWGKYIYVKNNKTGEIWNPTWSPVKTDLDHYECRHGIGYTKFITIYKGIEIKLIMFVPFNESLEIWDITVANNNNDEVDLSFFTYFEWVLGSSADHHREFHKQFLETEFDESIKGIKARKRLWDIPIGDRGHWNTEYEYTGFFTCSKTPTSYEGDKEKFIGNYGSLDKPKAVSTGIMTQTTGTFNDSIASLKIDVSLPSKSEERLQFFLGLSKNDLKSSLQKYNSNNLIDEAFENVAQKWNDILGTLNIETPDTSLNYMVNTWSRYQAISARLWGRTAYYQQSGAFGFRDQLQDSLVFLPINPELTKNQIKLHAKHQFVNGEVLHWWHPISETGLKTEMTDDLLWLPFVLNHYILETCDYKILEEEETFYDEPNSKASIYEHCRLAIEKVLTRFSERGIPLIGAGDWNDGMSGVGLEMKGESFWLSEFLYLILIDFAELSKKIGKDEYSVLYLEAAEKLKKNFNLHSWDGEWFIRATKDSGEIIGSSECSNGKIYLNPQTWSVISSIATEEKQQIAMNSVKEKLLKKNGCLLLQPAYTSPDKFIGYLSRYAAGRRENGGLYSHASTWAIWAFAKIGEDSFANEVAQRMNPINAGKNPDEYVAEPYVLPGNVDGPDSPNYGMGGWTWYTGSASWYQKNIVDWILGIRASKNGLIIDPHIPENWNSFKIKRMFRGTEFNITVNNPDGLSSGNVELIVNGVKQPMNILDDFTEQKVNVIATLIKK